MAGILVADDDRAVRQLVCMMLKSAGYRCFDATNGVEAVARFRSNRDDIDLVITDLMMPVMNGVQAVARIRETKPEIPVICMTGYNEESVPPDVHVLLKPFTRDALLNLVGRLLNP